MSTLLLKRLFTVEEYNLIIEAGILTEDERVELIRGEIIQMTAIGRRHAACVNRLVFILTQLLRSQIILSPQNPIELGENSQPEPDIVLLKPRQDFYESGHPQVRDIFLLVEVADSTIETDRDIKIPLYAEAGIIEVWLVDLNAECIEVYRQPTANGYENVQKLLRNQNLSIQAFSNIAIGVNEVLGI
jgi:Uma2 family endonuclease